MRTLWRALATLPYLHYHTARRAHAMRSSSPPSMSGSGGGGGASLGGLPAEAPRHDSPLITTIGYVTDIEGNRQFFDEYVRISRVLERDASNRLRLRDGCEFVFGGDVCDKGDGDMYVITELLDLKRRYPERVHLILGNRDVNKIRFAHELSRPVGARDPADAARCVAWWNAKMRPTAADDAERLRWMLAHTMGSAEPDTFELRRDELVRERRADLQLEAAEAVQPPAEDDDPARVSVFSLGSVLGNVFGGGVVGFGGVAPRSAGPGLDGNDAAAEAVAAAEAAAAQAPPSDAEVAASFRESVAPDGPLWHYLQSAQIGAVIGDCLFVHGALTAECVGQLPPSAGAVPSRDRSASGFETIGSLRPWVSALNGWASDELASWAVYPRGDPAHEPPWAMEGGYGGRGGEGLVQYGMGSIPTDAWTRGEPGAKLTPNPTVIYASWFDNGAPTEVSGKVLDFLREAGVRTVLSGHQPIGDTPAVLRPAEDLTMIVADTSYSNNVRWLRPPPPSRLPSSPAGLELSKLQLVHTRPDGSGKPAQVAPGGGNRGVAVLEVAIEMDRRLRFGAVQPARTPNPDPTAEADERPCAPTRVCVHGSLSDGRCVRRACLCAPRVGRPACLPERLTPRAPRARAVLRATARPQDVRVRAAGRAPRWSRRRACRPMRRWRLVRPGATAANGRRRCSWRRGGRARVRAHARRGLQHVQSRCP